MKPHIVLLATMILGAGVVSGQDYPNKPIHLVAGPAGGGTDFVARQIAQGISGPLGQPVIVDNRQTRISIDATYKSPADGYALLVIGATLWVQPLLEKVPFDAVRDYSPISLISREVNVFAVHPSLPVHSIKELIALAKARPGVLNYGVGAIGGPQHLGVELFKSMAGIHIVQIPYSGSTLAITALISGEVQMVMIGADLLMPHAKTGRVRALAVTSLEPSAMVPGLPTVAASGLPGYESVSMAGIFATGKPPAAIIHRLNQEIVRFLSRPDVKEKFLNTGSEVVANSPEQFADIIKTNIAKMDKVIRDSGIKIK